MSPAYQDELITLYQADSYQLLRQLSLPDYTIITDMPHTIRCNKDVEDTFRFMRVKPRSYLVFTNPEHGFVTPAGVFLDSRCKPVGQPPSYARPQTYADTLVAMAQTDTIVDPFCGTGTTLIAARRAGKRCVGIDNNRHTVAVLTARLTRR
jgi:DNA methylase